MKSFICMCLSVLLLVSLCGCSSNENTVVTTDPDPLDTSATEPITAPADPVMMTVADLMPMQLSTIAEFSTYIAVVSEEGHRVYMVQNTTDSRQFKLDIRHGEDGVITEATLSYGDTSASLVGDGASVTGAIREIMITEPLELPEMTMENLLVLDPTDVIALNGFAFTEVDATHRQYSVVNNDSGKHCTLDIVFDGAGTVTQATLSYGDVSRDMLKSSMIAILDVMTEMEGAAE